MIMSKHVLNITGTLPCVYTHHISCDKKKTAQEEKRIPIICSTYLNLMQGNFFVRNSRTGTLEVL